MLTVRFDQYWQKYHQQGKVGPLENIGSLGWQLRQTSLCLLILKYLIPH